MKNISPQNIGESSNELPASSAGEVRSSNTALGNNNTNTVKPSSLRHFGCDWLSFFINVDRSPEVTNALASLFETNRNNEYFNNDQFVWLDPLFPLDVEVIKSKNDYVALLRLNNRSVVSIKQITEESTYVENVKNQYHYYVTFYGHAFVLDRNFDFAISRVLQKFIEPQKKEEVKINLSMIHICFDINHLTTQQIEKGIKVKSKNLAKESSRIAISPIDDIAETVYYGKKTGHYYFRIYNKLLEIDANNTARYYKMYWSEKLLTRVELVVKSTNLRKFQFQLEDVLDISKLMGLMERHINQKFITWKVWKFVEKEMNDCDMYTAALEVFQPESNELFRNSALDRLVNGIMKYSEEVGLEPEEVSKRIVVEINRPLADDVWWNRK